MSNSSIVNCLGQLIHAINKAITAQLNVILHESAFQQLEASWRSLHNLHGQLSLLQSPLIKLKCLTVTIGELQHDLLIKHAEFDDTDLFHKTYTEHFDQPGGEPFSLIIGDYCFNHKVYNRIDNVAVLTEISKIMSASMTVWLTAADASLVDLNCWSELQPYHRYEPLSQRHDYDRWQQFRRSQEAQFIGMVAPKILLRRPYQQSEHFTANFFFEETINTHQNLLWGNPAYVYASAIIKSFFHSGWFLNIRAPLEAQSAYANPANNTTIADLNLKEKCETIVTDTQEKRLNQLGLIVLREHKLHFGLCFYSHPSLHNPPHYNRAIVNSHAHLSCGLQYLLCAARFLQTIKIMMRDKVGLFTSTEECQTHILNWILNYCSANPQTRDSIHHYPLQQAQIQIQPDPEQSGRFHCITHIKPHCFIETIDSSLKLTSNIILDNIRTSPHAS